MAIGQWSFAQFLTELLNNNLFLCNLALSYCLHPCLYIVNNMYIVVEWFHHCTTLVSIMMVVFTLMSERYTTACIYNSDDSNFFTVIVYMTLNAIVHLKYLVV